MTAFSELLTDLRNRKRVTAWELARTISVSEETVRRWEAGITIPSTRNVAAIAEALNLTARDRKRVADLYTWSSS